MHGIYFWIGFNVLIVLLLILDLGLFQRKKIPSAKDAWVHTIFWVALALLFNIFVYFSSGPESALQFLAGYLIEKSLSVDNLFVFLTIFLHFRVSEEMQHKVLFWGILGALVFRFCLIFVGISLIGRFHWISFVLGAFLIFTGIQFALQKQKEDPSKSWSFRFFKKILPRGKASSILIVLLMIEATDILFALDSIPAIFAITTDPFIVYTSNVFAILGLRSLYFILAANLGKLKYYKVGLAAILVFVGLKMVLTNACSISIPVSLGVVIAILGATTFFSVIKK